MYIFRSFLFFILMIIWTAIIPIIYSPSFIFRSRKLADHGAKIWAITSIWMLKKLCNIDYEVLGLENLPKNEAVIIACKHQSMWETIIMHLLMKHPVYAFKKELLKVPFYGWFVGAMSGIKVDRQGRASALKDLIKQSKSYLKNGQNIVIFPQGTRVPVGENTKKYPYQSGVAAIYLNCQIKVIPAALNSGKFWPKSATKKQPGTIKIKFLEPIEVGLKKAEFLKELEEKIEKESDKLLG